MPTLHSDRQWLPNEIVDGQLESYTHQEQVERRRLVWRFFLSFGVIAGTVTAATLVARWMR